MNLLIIRKVFRVVFFKMVLMVIIVISILKFGFNIV